MNKNLSIDDAVDSILREENNIVGNLQPGKPITGTMPCPKATQNKVRIPPPIKGSEFDSSVERNLYKQKKCKKNNCEEDAEEILPDEEVKEIILQQFNGLTSRTTGIALHDLLGYFQTIPEEYSKNQIMRILQRLINKNQIKLDTITKKMFLCNDEDEEDAEDTEFLVDEEDAEEDYITPEEIINDEEPSLTNDIEEYFQTSTAGSVSGIPYNQALKDLSIITGYAKQEIASSIKELMSSGILKKGVTDGTIIVNSIEEEEEGSIIPTGVNNNSTLPIPIMNQETPETLKAKGWTEISPGMFLGPDGVQKYAITEDFNYSGINKFMSYKDDDMEKLFEEFDSQFAEIEGFDDSDNMENTDGLDEFETEENIDIEGDGEITITLSQDEADILDRILKKIKGEDVGEEELVDDLASDEEANIDLMGSDDDEFESEDDYMTDEDAEDEFNFDFEEDEENIADENAGGNFDGSFSNGAPNLKKQTPPTGDFKRKPITGKGYTPTNRQAYDATGRDGSPKLQKQTPQYDKSGKPVNSNTTKKAGTKTSIFDL